MPPLHTPSRPRRAALLLALALALALPSTALRAQAPGVPIHEDGAEKQRILRAAEALKEAGKLRTRASLHPKDAPQHCALQLPPARNQPLPSSAVHEHARKGFMGIGTLYLCQKCDHWHTNTAGGYAITADGIAATCFHVLADSEVQMREGYVFAYNDAGEAFPVTEVLAANQAADIALVRTEARGCSPLPLSTDGHPGDPVFCLSSPKDIRGLFTQGILSRYFRDPRKAVFLHVTTDWAAGSSGCAILDACGNALGHVASTRTLLWRDENPAPKDVQMTLKQAASARELLQLTAPK